MNWINLKNFCDTLSEEQLKMPVKLCGEEIISIKRAETLEEDYVSVHNEYSIPVSEFEEDVYDMKLEDLPIIHKKGEPWLWMD